LNYGTLRCDNSGPEPIAKSKTTRDDHCIVSGNPVFGVPQKVCRDPENVVKHVMNITIAIAAGENGNPDPCHLGRGNFDSTRIKIFVTGLETEVRFRLATYGSIVFIFIRQVWLVWRQA
jgi:hypothetical protein